MKKQLLVDWPVHNNNIAEISHSLPKSWASTGMFDFALKQFYLVWIAEAFNLHKVGYYNGDGLTNQLRQTVTSYSLAQDAVMFNMQGFLSNHSLY